MGSLKTRLQTPAFELLKQSEDFNNNFRQDDVEEALLDLEEDLLSHFR